jgi:dihydroorotate dehydrogenase
VGNWIDHPQCTRVRGSFTAEPRRGLVWNTLKSLRPIRGGWVNRIGLRNPGIDSLTPNTQDVYSVVGIEYRDWEYILDALGGQRLNIEVNLGCPNVHDYGIPEEVLGEYTKRHNVSAKLPQTEDIDAVAEMCVRSQVDYLHVSNTLPTPRGGESGRRLKALNVPIVKRLAARYPEMSIIAGGGIYDSADIADYEAAGAKHFSLATIWFRPWRAQRLLRDAR